MDFVPKLGTAIPLSGNQPTSGPSAQDGSSVSTGTPTPQGSSAGGFTPKLGKSIPIAPTSVSPDTPPIKTPNGIFSTLHTLAKSAVTSAGQSVAGFGHDVSKIANDTWQKLKTDVSQDKGIGIANLGDTYRSGLSAAADVGQGLTDVAGSILNRTGIAPAVSGEIKNMGDALSLITPKAIQNPVKEGLGILASGATDKYNQWASKNPDAADQLSKWGKVLSGAAVVEGGISAAGTAKKALTELPEAATKKFSSWWDALKSESTPAMAETTGVPISPETGAVGSELAPKGVTEPAAAPKEAPQTISDKIYQPHPDAIPVNPEAKQAALRAGMKEQFVNLTEGASPADVEAMKSMQTAAEGSSKSYLSERPSDIAGKTILERVDHLDAVQNQSGKELGQAVKTLPTEPVSIQPVLNNFLGKLDDMGIKVGRNGTLDFSGSSLSGTSAGETQKLLTKTYQELIGNGSAEMTPQRMHTLRQSIFSDLNLGKANSVLDSRADVVLNGVRGDLGGQLGSLSPEYAAASQKYAIAEKALQSFDQLMGKKFARSGEEIMSRRAGEVGSRIASNASADAIQTLQKLEDAAAQTGFKAKNNPMRQIFFADGLNDIYDTTMPRSFQGGVSRGVKEGTELAKTALEATHNPLGAITHIFMRSLENTPEKAQAALRQLLESIK